MVTGERFVQLVLALLVVVVVMLLLSILAAIAKWVNAKADMAKERAEHQEQLNTEFWTGKVRHKRTW